MTSETTPPLIREPRLWLAAVLVVYLALALRLVFLLPLWGAVQDEPLHFGYARYLAVKGTLPFIERTDASDLRFYYTAPSAGDAAHHPPGFYFTVSLVLRLFAHASLATQNYVARGTSTLLGLLALLFWFGTLRRLLPRQPAIAVGVTAAVAVFPQWLMICATVHPEVFGATFYAATLWALARYQQTPSRWQGALLAGCGAGLLALDKMTMLPFCAAAAVTLLLVGTAAGLAWRTRLTHLALFGLAAATLCGWWFIRNQMTYGQFMPSTDMMLGTTRHTQLFLKDGSQDMIAFLFIPQGQVRYRLALEGAFRYFWSPGDWLPPSARALMYTLGGGVWLLLPVGLGSAWKRRDETLAALWRPWLLPFLGALALLYAMYIRWTVLVAIQAHAELGRWLMPQLGMLALLWTLAVQGLTRRRGLLVALALLLAFLLAWDVLSLQHLATVLIPKYGGNYPAPG